jgi:hypothetical protein
MTRSRTVNRNFRIRPATVNIKNRRLNSASSFEVYNLMVRGKDIGGHEHCKYIYVL